MRQQLLLLFRDLLTVQPQTFQINVAAGTKLQMTMHDERNGHCITALSAFDSRKQSERLNFTQKKSIRQASGLKYAESLAIRAQGVSSWVDVAQLPIRRRSVSSNEWLPQMRMIWYIDSLLEQNTALAPLLVDSLFWGRGFVPIHYESEL
jgi:hypothetical protein